MHVIRNVPVVGWWFVLALTVETHPAVIFGIATLLLMAGPWLRWFNKRSDPQSVRPLRGIAQFSTVCTMSWLSLAKAAGQQGLIAPHRGGMSERT
jgi:hypothetical protein